MEKAWGRITGIRGLAGILTILLLYSGVAAAQVFPPRPQSQPAPSSPVPNPGQPGQMSVQPAPPPQPSGPPGSLTSTIPFGALLGDPTKAFIQIGNMRTPMDTNFLLGRGLVGRITVDKYTSEAGNGKPVFLHVNGLSTPPDRLDRRAGTAPAVCDSGSGLQDLLHGLLTRGRWEAR